MSFFLTSIFLSNVLIGQNAGLPNITGTFGVPQIYNGSEGAFSTSGTGFSLAVNGAVQSSHANLDASRGETKTDGTLKTEEEYHVYGATNGVQPQNISIRLWKRIS